eukprot:CAMPEP_0182424928 /NCGR_PEP_ID=MMETSP1167-20130531/11226_1 /TAXON_ID=2988 /ORGANISM="Mallomonas Sp, Strain CCMP3275" /LENGTH=295 /DNA_ID=CAMNT_0024605133 /DNA_START=387 /DNA_END=1270 /DNA_ORIENTATION=-
MATFSFLCPQSVPVVGVNCLGRCNKGPNARILTTQGAFIEAAGVNSVQLAVQLLQTHLQLDVNVTSSEALRLNYDGNVYLSYGEVDKAIDCYNKALELGDNEQEGVLLVMRGTALLQRAYGYRMRYKDLFAVAQEVLPCVQTVACLMTAIQIFPPAPRLYICLHLFKRLGRISRQLETSVRWMEVKETWPEAKDVMSEVTAEILLRRISFSWSMYEHSLSSALDDLLLATQVLPGFSQAWRRAGDALAEFRWFHSAILYYEVALKLDEDLSPILLPAMEKLRLLEKLMDNAYTKG